MPAASVTELSLGPPQGSLGVIMEEGSKEAGSEADEGHSAPQADSRMASAAQDLATRGKKRRETSSCLVSLETGKLHTGVLLACYVGLAKSSQFSMDPLRDADTDDG